MISTQTPETQTPETQTFVDRFLNSVQPTRSPLNTLKQVLETASWARLQFSAESRPDFREDSEPILSAIVKRDAHPERFRPLIEERYLSVCERYRKSISSINESAPPSFSHEHARLIASMRRTVDHFPLPSDLSFAELVEAHDLLASSLARFGIIGKLLS